MQRSAMFPHSLLKGGQKISNEFYFTQVNEIERPIVTQYIYHVQVN